MTAFSRGYWATGTGNPSRSAWLSRQGVGEALYRGRKCGLSPFYPGKGLAFTASTLRLTDVADSAYAGSV